MRDFKVESDFEYNGMRCVVLFLSRGHRCGYVGIPKNHPLYGCDYSKKSEYLSWFKLNGEPVGKRGILSIVGAAFDDDKNEFVTPELYFNVHGGITYAGGGVNSKYPIESDLWWFGFDCAHAGDKKDVDALYKYDFVDENMERVLAIDREYFIPNEIVRTQEYVEQECRELADQLVKISE